MKILNFGSLNIDYVYGVEHFVTAGETEASKSLEVNTGGKGLNQSVALARAGAQVFHAGCIGEDGLMLRDFLEKNGVDVSMVSTVATHTGHAIIQVEPNGQNCILLHSGANFAVTFRQVNEVLSHFGHGDYLLLQNEISNVGYIMKSAREKGMKIFFNPSPVTASLAQMPLDLADTFILNKTEGQALVGGEDIDIPSALSKRFPNADFVLTLGEQGAKYFGGAQLCEIEAKRVKAVDTTAAGDTFTGFYIAAVMRGEPIKSALEQATAAAAISVTRPGAAASIPYLREI